MSRKYKFHDQDSLYFITYAVVQWIDVFTREDYNRIILDSWKYCIDKKGLEVSAWCIMTNHIHMIIGSHGEPIEGIVRDMKSYTSTTLKKMLTSNHEESRRDWILAMMEQAGKMNSQNNDFQFWQQHNKPMPLTDNYIIDQKLDYIHNNPVKAGYVDNPQDWRYSSARDYCGIKGLLDGLRMLD
jgi:REP element-mobilizing transposase RayT